MNFSKNVGGASEWLMLYISDAEVQRTKFQVVPLIIQEEINNAV